MAGKIIQAAGRVTAYGVFTFAMVAVAAWLGTWETYVCLLSGEGGGCTFNPVHPEAVLWVPIGIAVVLVEVVLSVELGLRRRK